MHTIADLADLIVAGEGVPAAWQPRRPLPLPPKHWYETTPRFTDDLGEAIEAVMTTQLFAIRTLVGPWRIKLYHGANAAEIPKAEGGWKLLRVRPRDGRLTAAEAAETLQLAIHALNWDIVSAGCESPLAAAIRAIARLSLPTAVRNVPVTETTVIEAVAALLAADSLLLHRDGLRLLTNPALLATPAGQDLLFRGRLISDLITKTDGIFKDADAQWAKVSAWTDLLTQNLAGKHGEIRDSSITTLETIQTYDVSPYQIEGEHEREISAEIDRIWNEPLVVVVPPKPLTRDQVTWRIATLIAQDPKTIPSGMLAKWVNPPADLATPRVAYQQMDAHAQRRVFTWYNLLTAAEAMRKPSPELHRDIAEVIHADQTQLVDRSQVEPRFLAILGTHPRAEGLALLRALEQLRIGLAKAAQRTMAAAKG